MNSGAGFPSAEAICVDPKQVEHIWECVKHWIKRAMERGDLGTFEAIEDDVIAGQALLWLVWIAPTIQGAAVTQIGHGVRLRGIRRIFSA